MLVTQLGILIGLGGLFCGGMKGCKGLVNVCCCLLWVGVLPLLAYSLWVFLSASSLQVGCQSLPILLSNRTTMGKVIPDSQLTQVMACLAG